MPLFLGADAGNSKTAVLACLPSGDVVGAGRSGCGDIYGPAGEAAAVRSVLAAADEALAVAGATRSQVCHAAFRLAGVDWPEDGEFWDAALAREWPGLSRSVLGDGYAAIRCGEPSGIGVAVNAGTAAAIAARGPDGRMWDMGWWGQHAMGAIGLVSEALKAVYLASLGAGPETALGPALLDFYGRPDLPELNRWFTRRRNPAGAAERWRAARVAAGPPAHPAHPTPPAVPVILTGSVLADRDSPVATAVEAHLSRLLPGADPRRVVLPPVAGAALDALAEGGVPITEDLIARLAATVPPPEFLET